MQLLLKWHKTLYMKPNNTYLMNIRQGTSHFKVTSDHAYFAGFTRLCDATLIQLSTIPSLCRHQGAAFDHECHMRLRPQQGDQLHGTRPDGGLPAGQVQCRVGRQAPVDPALLHALLRD